LQKLYRHLLYIGSNEVGGGAQPPHLDTIPLKSNLPSARILQSAEVGDQPAAANPGLTEQDAASATRHQDSLASAAFKSERARVAEQTNYQLRG